MQSKANAPVRKGNTIVTIVIMDESITGCFILDG